MNPPSYGGLGDTDFTTDEIVARESALHASHENTNGDGTRSRITRTHDRLPARRDGKLKIAVKSRVKFRGGRAIWDQRFAKFAANVRRKVD